MQSFTKEFGVYDERQELYVLPAWLSSVMTATPFLGKAMVCVSPATSKHFSCREQVTDFSACSRGVFPQAGLQKNGGEELAFYASALCHLCKNFQSRILFSNVSLTGQRRDFTGFSYDGSSIYCWSSHNVCADGYDYCYCADIPGGDIPQSPAWHVCLHYASHGRFCKYMGRCFITTSR